MIVGKYFKILNVSTHMNEKMKNIIAKIPPINISPNQIMFHIVMSVWNKNVMT